MTHKKRRVRATMLLKKTFNLNIGTAKKLAKNFLATGFIDTDIVWDTLGGDKNIKVITDNWWDDDAKTTIMVDGIDLGNLFWTHPSIWGKN